MRNSAEKQKRKKIPRILFDKKDYELLSIVNEVIDGDKSLRSTKKLLHPYLHPLGIKEMAATKGLRVAYAVIHLLASLEAGKADDRIRALRSLQDEVLTIAHTSLRNNTARVLLEIMKELVRFHGKYIDQLKLAHDFGKALSGKPVVIRKLLKRYHLLEMPEKWNQLAFDHHVHDANTKGRKSPTHLIMDAWIKGIRRLTVVYYNYIQPEAADELLEAAKIMNIHIRLGIEVTTKFRDRYVNIIWAPRGFLNKKDFLHFMSEAPVVNFMSEGRTVSEYQQQYVFSVLKEFNNKHRFSLIEQYGITLSPLNTEEFLKFVGVGQPSILHLAKFIHTKLLPAMESKVLELREKYTTADANERMQIDAEVKEMNELSSELIVDRFLRPAKNQGIPNPDIPQDSTEVPNLLKLSPEEMLNKLSGLHSGYRATLNLTNLSVADVLELLYDCKGMITHLEIFNLKEYSSDQNPHLAKINKLQLAINDGNLISLKRTILEIIRQMETAEISEPSERIEKFNSILRDISTLRMYYESEPLNSHICSDSSGSSNQLLGMGLAITDTLPMRVQKALRKKNNTSHNFIPMSMSAFLQTTYLPESGSNSIINFFKKVIRRTPLLRVIFQKHDDEWILQKHSTRMATDGNIITLGGLKTNVSNDLYIEEPKKSKSNARWFQWQYLNGGLKNAIKIIIGFIPAFATFVITKDWWLLAYFGAFIWFGITGLRNILQSVLGGGGIRRSPLLSWGDYVSWERVSDSLLFTGFSVPLLDYLTKTVILNHVFGITTATDPDLLYTIMAIVNGVYISGHNTFRGLPKGAIFGNFFRSILSIPIAIGLNVILGNILGAAGVVGVLDILQKWAAVISKTASDFVAGIIEGLADRFKNIKSISKDYHTKIEQLYNIYAKLETLFPETEVLSILESSKKIIKSDDPEVRDLGKIIIVHSLDLLYFWMFQPRSRSALRIIMKTMPNEELQIFVRTQNILRSYKDISLMFIDGIVGKNFSKALAFYLARYEEYLKAIKQMKSSFIGQASSIGTLK